MSVQWQCFCLSVVGLPARPKSPVDSKKEVDCSSVYSSSLPSSDGPEHCMSSSRTPVNSDEVFVLLVICILSTFTAFLVINLHVVVFFGKQGVTYFPFMLCSFFTNGLRFHCVSSHTTASDT